MTDQIKALQNMTEEQRAIYLEINKNVQETLTELRNKEQKQKEARI